MSTARPGLFIVAVSASLAMAVFVNARGALAQEAPVSGTSVDANWESTGPGFDENAASADKVLEIPPASCASDGSSGPCDSAAPDSSGNDPNDQAINAPSPGAPPQSFDEDTASSGSPDSDWGTADDYQNQPAYGAPYVVVVPYSVAASGATPMSQVRGSTLAPMSGPLTQPARPPLNQGPWMTPPAMSTFSRPAGSPMMGMTTSRPAWGFHH